MAEGVETLEVGKLDPTFCDELASQPGGEHVRRCFACGTCVAGCPVSEVAPEFSPRKLVRQILFGMREEVLSSPLIWYCLVCYRCTARCPQGVDFADVMRALRFMALKGHHAPPNVVGTVAEIDRELQASRAERIRSKFEEELAAFVRERAEAKSKEEAADEEEADASASEEPDAQGAESSTSEEQATER